MEKFSFYNLLSILLPGFVFASMFNIVLETVSIESAGGGKMQHFFITALSPDWSGLIVLSLIAGAVIYAVSFELVKKCKCIYRFTGVYRSITLLFYENKMHSSICQTLNRKSKEWYNKEAFPEKTEFDALSGAERKERAELQDLFYDRMYYELDYEGKLETAKEFQSLYLFSRSLLVAVLSMLLIMGMLFLLSLLCVCFTVSALFGWLFAGYLAALFFAVSTAKWYRKRMVAKMFWYFYSHINSKNT